MVVWFSNYLPNTLRSASAIRLPVCACRCLLRVLRICPLFRHAPMRRICGRVLRSPKTLLRLSACRFRTMRGRWYMYAVRLSSGASSNVTRSNHSDVCPLPPAAMFSRRSRLSAAVVPGEAVAGFIAPLGIPAPLPLDNAPTAPEINPFLGVAAGVELLLFAVFMVLRYYARLRGVSCLQFHYLCGYGVYGVVGGCFKPRRQGFLFHLRLLFHA